jgi:hypothetical protein
VPWWTWLLIAWAALAPICAIVLGAVAGKARMRERARRRHYDEAAAKR